MHNIYLSDMKAVDNLLNPSSSWHDEWILQKSELYNKADGNLILYNQGMYARSRLHFNDGGTIKPLDIKINAPAHRLSVRFLRVSIVLAFE